MKIIKSSTSDISFFLEKTTITIHEQDFILVIDSNKKPLEQYLAQIERLIQTGEGEIKGTASIIGKIDLENYSLLPCRFPVSLEAQIVQPPDGLVSKILSFRGEKGIYLGNIITSSNKTEPFLISPNFLERHLLCVASTGAGKSYSVGVMLEEILLKFDSASVILFDVHNEYWGLTQPNEGKEIELLHYENYSPQGFTKNVLIVNKGSIALGKYFDLAKIRRLVELTAAQENSLLNLIKEPKTLDELSELIQNSDMHSSTRDNLLSKINSLKNLKFFEEELVLEDLIQSRQISIIRLDQFIDERRRNLLVNEMLTQLFEKKIQGELAREKEIILVVEEAHRFSATSEILARIAREGRKFGIHEILISQRPGDLPDNIIANMNTLIALRIKSDKDISKIRLMEGISSEIVSVLPHLVRGEALLVGLQTGYQRPIKIKVRPRLSKHINPQEDQMPTDLHYYKQIMNHKTPFIVPKSLSDRSDSLDFLTEVEPFDYKDLTNLLTCKHIIIVHKKTGICVFELGVSMMTIDPQLVSGFLTAISGLFSELKDQSLIKERTIVRIFTEEIGDRAFKIITVEGIYSIAAMILDRTPKYMNRLKQRMREFVYTFENKYSSHLIEFIGILDDFQPVIQLLDHFLGLSLLTPLQINQANEGKVSHPTLFNIISNQMDQLASPEGVFVEEIVNQCLLDSDYSYHEITEAIIQYLKDEVLILKYKGRNTPSFVPQSSKRDLSIDEIKKSDYVESSELEESVDKQLSINGTETEKEFFELDSKEKEINWFKTILSDIRPSSIPDSLKMDILERDLIFESNLRLKTKSMRSETYDQSELNRWATIMTNKGFTLDFKSPNPLKGIKIVLKMDNIRIAHSIALKEDGKYLIIFAECL